MDLVRVNIKTGECFCRIREFWESQGYTRSEIGEEKAGRHLSPILAESDIMPPGLKTKLQVINLSSQGLENHDISIKTGVPVLRVGHILYWRERITLQARAIEQYLEGKTAFQITQMLNVSTAWVKNVIKKYA